MGNAEGGDGDVTEPEGSTIFKEAPIGFALKFSLDGLGCIAVGVKGDRFVAGEPTQAGGVVRMFVGDQDGIEGFNRFTCLGQQLLNAAPGKSGINEDLALIRNQQGTIA